jgi:hypothetical protein
MLSFFPPSKKYAYQRKHKKNQKKLKEKIFNGFHLFLPIAVLAYFVLNLATAASIARLISQLPRSLTISRTCGSLRIRSQTHVHRSEPLMSNACAASAAS